MYYYPSEILKWSRTSFNVLWKEIERLILSISKGAMCASGHESFTEESDIEPVYSVPQVAWVLSIFAMLSKTFMCFINCHFKKWLLSLWCPNRGKTLTNPCVCIRWTTLHAPTNCGTVHPVPACISPHSCLPFRRTIVLGIHHSQHHLPPSSTRISCRRLPSLQVPRHIYIWVTTFEEKSLLHTQ